MRTSTSPLELVELVRVSFKTFSQVVRDNGLLAAFSEEGSYGSCSGYVIDAWWTDMIEDEYIGLKPGEGEYGDIATDVCEDKGGDSLERTIERMHAFNKERCRLSLQPHGPLPGVRILQRNQKTETESQLGQLAGSMEQVDQELDTGTACADCSWGGQYG